MTTRSFKKIRVLPSDQLSRAKLYRFHVSGCQTCAFAEHALRPNEARCVEGQTLFLSVFNQFHPFPTPEETYEAMRWAGVGGPK